MEAVDVARGATLSLPPFCLARLVRGEVLLHVAKRPLEVVRAPAWLDVLGARTGRAQATYVAVTDVVIEMRDAHTLSPNDWNAALASESERHWARAASEASRGDDLFLPGAVPIAGPWWFRTAHARVLVVRGDPRRLATMLPPSVRLVPGTAGRYVIAMVRFEGAHALDREGTEPFAYHEVTPFVPAFTVRTGPVAFVPELYPDAPMAAALGREIHGFPKRLGRIAFERDGADLIVARALALRTRFRRRRPIDRFELTSAIARAMTGSDRIARAAAQIVRTLDGRTAPRFSVLVRKRIGAPETAGRTLAIDALVRVPFVLDEIRDAAVLEDFDAQIADGQDVLHGHVEAAFALTTGLRFGVGHTLRTYR